MTIYFKSNEDAETSIIQAILHKLNSMEDAMTNVVHRLDAMEARLTQVENCKN